MNAYWKLKCVIISLVHICCVLGLLKQNILQSRFCCLGNRHAILNAVNKRDKSLDKIIMDIDFKRANDDKIVPLTEDPLYPLVRSAILAGNSRKANEIKAFRISHLTEIASFMVILQGNSSPQNQAIANSVEELLEAEFSEHPKKQGDASGGWILLDYGSIIVHVMTPQMRNFYKLEKRWKEAHEVDISLIISEDELKFNSKSRIDQIDESEDGIDDDPFWQ